MNLTVVVGHFRLPEERLTGFLAWNRELFQKYAVHVNLVTDRCHEKLPENVTELIYPAPLPVYSPSRVSNYGIRQAGAGRILKTDIDCVFSEDALREALAVCQGRGVFFNYRMCKSYETREQNLLWGAGCGTMCLDYSDWDRIHGYDERQEGYGVEDGDGVARARQVLHLRHSRATIWHIAHTGDEVWTQANRCFRRDLWNRSSGFCPDRHVENKRVRDSGVPWRNPQWGIPS
ncbi:MAG: galactosyltransferase-related protein [Armatimonadia bacterium]